MLSGTFLSLSVFTASAVAAPTVSLLDISAFAGEKTGRYIVKFKEGASAASQLTSFTTSSSASNITHEYKDQFFNGFAGEFDDDSLTALRSNPDVALIEEDGIVYASEIVEQTDAPWGLSRVSQDGPVTGSSTDVDYTYSYDSTAGEGVDIYIVDTGIYVDHEDFGGRATWGATFGGYADEDGNGHGTHCAGTAAGTRWGVAKAANLIAVKILSDSGSGTVSDIVAGLEFVADSAASSGNPTVASMSLGGSASTSLDNAVEALVDAGVHVAVAAGNEGTDAGTTSPARVPVAVTVGASNIDDEIAYFSNYGEVVDIFAPGEDITSTWNDGDTNTISGTSMATPHVAGLIAYYIGVNGNDSPDAITDLLTSGAIQDALSGVPSSTANLLARNDA